MKMKNKFFLLFAVFFSFLSFSQIEEPVKWNFESKKIAVNEYELLFTAKIDAGWHLYSQFLPSDDGPIATKFTFENNKDVQFSGKVTEPKAKKEFDPNFNMDLNYHEKEVIFKQKIKLNKAGKIKVVGEIEYMVCDATKCLPPEYPAFEFTLVGEDVQESKSEPTTTEKTVSTEVFDLAKIEEPVEWKFEALQIDESNYELIFTAQIEKGWHIYSQKLPEGDGPVPTSFLFESNSDVVLVDVVSESEEVIEKYDPNFDMELRYFENVAVFKQKITVIASQTVLSGAITFMSCDEEKCLPPEDVEFKFELTGKAQTGVISKKKDSSKSLVGIFIAGFLGGLLALLTPCVFPMIPLTVSFFTKQSKSRAKGLMNALLYGLSIIAIYVTLAFSVTVIFGADAMNSFSTNVWVNLAFFILFVVFAISFFGAFEITLPNSWINKADSASDKGGLIGIFFMAFTLSLVSFSCTGPIIGTLLVEAANLGGVSGPIAGMFGFSFALALPFGLFAAFPGWLNSLPQSGGWLNSVKVVLGFLELALALKFLSNADLVVQTGLLQREVFIAIWIAIFLMLTMYLLGVFKLSHDSESSKISVGRLLFAIVSLMFTIYLIPGMWGAPLKIISGFPPPMFYSESPNGVGGSSTMISSSGGQDIPKGADPDHCPHNLNCFHDYETGMAYAKQVGKPVLLDFTGWACVNCRKMEEQVWSDPRVLTILRNDVVLISLYVDEKTALPLEEQIEVTIGTKTKKLKTIGNKWSYFQANKYNTNSQPYYVLLDHNENQLLEAAAYDPNVDIFLNWLETGKKRFSFNK
jgi:thiol:disulfide interchange protein